MEERAQLRENIQQFRFQHLEIRVRAAPFSSALFELADGLETKKLFRFAEQLRAATLSVTTNIAEGSGSSSDAEFASFLNMARRSVFEIANILLILSENTYIELPVVRPLLDLLEEESRMLNAFIKNLRAR